MRVAILGTRGIPARYGGFETFAEKLAIGLVTRGLDVTVFCESGEFDAPDVPWCKTALRFRFFLGPLQTILYDCDACGRLARDTTSCTCLAMAPLCSA